ncbi:cyanophycinase [Adhaeribacter rhizoryzae]|uniref:Cyanophycinase n=1 Tax=Adhaeribacter rhizoryzae TaxID=2607907 RepID=A0A5M6DSE3_9BACT|nr:cyanophycinase [Adhaeribacter rhizoryzae]KAA5549236.1 cyanophycinase [Adhaeribacter rhizoryzae]
MKKPKGTLIALGGGGDDVLLKLIHSEHCHGKAAIEVITTAAPEPEESGQAYVDAFEELGQPNVRFMHIDEENEADQPDYLRRIKNADVIFFTGGDQRRILKFLKDTQVHKLMKERYLNEDLIIAGTSAGSAAMSDRMIYEGYGPYSLEKGRTKTSAGLSFIKKVYIDTHFTERGRFGRLSIAVSQHPEYIGIGLGEETGVIIREGNLIEVFGIGVVTIIDGAEIKYSNIHEVAPGLPIAVEHLVMHLLVEGHQYSLKDKKIGYEPAKAF